jgi:hypothetical protein
MSCATKPQLANHRQLYQSTNRAHRLYHLKPGDPSDPTLIFDRPVAAAALARLDIPATRSRIYQHEEADKTMAKGKDQDLRSGESEDRLLDR